MKLNTASKVTGLGFSSAARSHLNRHIGWCLLIVAFAIAARRGPRFLEGASLSGPALEMQTMIAVLGVLQLAAAQLLRDAGLASDIRNIVTTLTTSGLLLAALGFVSDLRLTAIGALMNFAGYTVFISRLAIRRSARKIGTGVVIICFGMLLTAAMAVYGWQANHVAIIDLGPDDGFTLRTLRLARVAAIVLPVLTFLYEDLSRRSEANNRIAGVGRAAMLCGTAGMASVLAGAGLVYVNLKLFLVIPSIAIFAGILCGLSLARHHAAPLETWGWLLIALSMAAGLVMGLYAFASPWVRFEFPGEYNDYARRLIRLAHVDAVVAGLSAIFIARDPDMVKNHWRRIGALFLVSGSVITVAMPLLLVLADLPTAILTVGPVLVSAAIIFCTASSVAQNKNVPQGGES